MTNQWSRLKCRSQSPSSTCRPKRQTKRRSKRNLLATSSGLLEQTRIRSPTQQPVRKLAWLPTWAPRQTQTKKPARANRASLSAPAPQCRGLRAERIRWWTQWSYTTAPNNTSTSLPSSRCLIKIAWSITARATFRRNIKPLEDQAMTTKTY